MRILDLFCGAGGAAVGYHRAGFEVVGVDINPQPNYPFEFVQADALEFVRDSLSGWGVAPYFDAIHASPPCQKWSSLSKAGNDHPDLITPLRPLLEATGVPYVIENVPGAPLENPIQLCGSSFGLDLRRHRLFESNIDLYGLPCVHGWQKKRFHVYDHGKHYYAATVPVYGMGGGKAKESWSRAMGIDWMSYAEMTEAIPPKYTEFLGAQLRAHIEEQATKPNVEAKCLAKS